MVLPQRFFKARRSLNFDEPVHIFDGFLSIPNDGAGARQRAGGKGAFAGSRGRARLVDIIAVEVGFQSLCGLRAGSVCAKAFHDVLNRRLLILSALEELEFGAVEGQLL